MAYIHEMGNPNFVVPVRVIVPAHVPIGPANMTKCLPNVHSWLDVLDGLGVHDIDPRGYLMEALRKRPVPPTSHLDQKVMDLLLHYNHRLGTNVPHRVHLVSRPTMSGVGPLRRRGQRFSPRVWGRLETIEEIPSNNEPQLEPEQVLNNPNPQDEAGPSGSEVAVAHNSAHYSFREEMASPELADIQFKTRRATRYARNGGACPTLTSQAGQSHSGYGKGQPQSSVGRMGQLSDGAYPPARDENSPVSRTWIPHLNCFVPTYASESESESRSGSEIQKQSQSGQSDGARGIIGPLRQIRSPLFGVQTTSEQQAPRINGNGEIGVEANRMQGRNDQQSFQNKTSNPHLTRLLQRSPQSIRPAPTIGSLQARNMQIAAQATDTNRNHLQRNQPTNAYQAPQMDNEIHERGNNAVIRGQEARPEERSELSMLATVANNRPRLDVPQVNNEPTLPVQPPQFQQLHSNHFTPPRFGELPVPLQYQQQPQPNPQQIQVNNPPPTHQNGFIPYRPWIDSGRFHPYINPNPNDFGRTEPKCGPTVRRY